MAVERSTGIYLVNISLGRERGTPLPKPQESFLSPKRKRMKGGKKGKKEKKEKKEKGKKKKEKKKKGKGKREKREKGPMKERKGAISRTRSMLFSGFMVHG